MRPSLLRLQTCRCFTLFWLALAGVIAADEPRNLFVEGYAGRVSYAPREDLTLHVSTSAASFPSRSRGSAPKQNQSGRQIQSQDANIPFQKMPPRMVAGGPQR